ncbi:hypothetical protein TrST_g9698 [Triparma strigata]|uniref:Leucine-rich repeat domain-containing protein n=1 Tax=Triparma strigata TaxID=1606541 RepID=A0A9W6ZUX2_9STRA|nr:hypothetical protein TrST_g9698 [Triparma strigata]
MSKRTSEDIENVIEILDPNNLEVVDDDTEVFEGSELDSAADETPATGGDDFMHTDDFRRLFVGFVMVDTLVAIRWLDRKWHKVVEKKLTEFGDEPYGEIIVHRGNDISYEEAFYGARMERMNLEQVGLLHTNVLELGTRTFSDCTSLREMKVPDSLQTFGERVFWNCEKLVPSTINVHYGDYYEEYDYDTIQLDTTSEVIAYLRSLK